MEAEQYFSYLLVAASLINIRWLKYEKEETSTSSLYGSSFILKYERLIKWFNNLSILFVLIVMPIAYKWYSGLISLFVGLAFFFILKLTYETVLFPLRLRLFLVQVLMLIVFIFTII